MAQNRSICINSLTGLFGVGLTWSSIFPYWWQPHPCPVSKCNKVPLGEKRWQALTRGKAALTVSTAWIPRSSCEEELGRNSLLLSPAKSFCKRLGRGEISLWLPREITSTPWTFMNAFTDSVNGDLGFGQCFCLLSGKWESLKFHYAWSLGRPSSLAWLQVGDGWLVETSSRYFCDTVSDSLAVCR